MLHCFSKLPICFSLALLVGCDRGTNSGPTGSAALGSGTFIDARDNQVYKWVTIGKQTWMAQNLNYRGDPNSKDTIGSCYNDLESNCAAYGRLYPWLQMMRASGGICPAGWHVPSDADWMQLLGEIGEISIDNTSGEIVALQGWHLKSRDFWENSSSGDDLYGFSVLPAGNRKADLTSYGQHSRASFWTKTLESCDTTVYHVNDVAADIEVTNNSCYAWLIAFNSERIVLEADTTLVGIVDSAATITSYSINVSNALRCVKNE